MLGFGARTRRQNYDVWNLLHKPLGYPDRHTYKLGGGTAPPNWRFSLMKCLPHFGKETCPILFPTGERLKSLRKSVRSLRGANGGGALPHREPSKAPFTIGISRAAPLAGQYARVIPLGPTVKVPLPVTLSGSSPAQEWLLGASSWWGCST